MGESIHFFEEAGNDHALSALFAYLSFFGGIFSCTVLDHVADFVLKITVGVPEASKPVKGISTKDGPKADTVGHLPDVEDDIEAAVLDFEKNPHSAWQLMRTGVLIALALALHNLPEVFIYICVHVVHS